MTPQTPRQPTPESPTSGIDWSFIWAQEGGNLVRTGLEATRLIPNLGILGGLAADGINAAQDLSAVPDGAGSGLMEATLVIRHLLNAGNNAIGSMIYVTQLIQDGLVGSVVGAEFAPVTAAANTIGNEGKVALDAIQLFLDAAVAIELHYCRVTSPPGSPEEAAWQNLLDGYQANIWTDIFNLANDGIGLASAGASQSGAIGQVKQSFRQIALTAKWAFPAMRSFLISLWNVWGSKATAEIPAAPTPAGPGVARTATGVLSRQGEDPLAAFAWDVVAGELGAMKSAYELGDTILGEASGYLAHRLEEANATMTALLDGRDPFEVVKEISVQVVADMNARIGQLGAMAATARDAQANAASVRELIGGVISSVEGFNIPDVTIPEVDVGEGLAADAAEALIGLGTGAANAGLEIVVAQVREAAESAKEALLEPLNGILAEADSIGEVIRIVAEGAEAQVAHVQEFVTQMQERLEASGSFTEMVEALINQALGLAGVDGEFSFSDIADAWHGLGPMLDEAITYAESRSAAHRGAAPAPAPGAGSPVAAAAAAPPEG